MTVGAGGSGSVNQVDGWVRQWEWGLSEPQVGKLTLGDGGEGTGEYILAGGELNRSGGELHISSTGSLIMSGGTLTNVGDMSSAGLLRLSSGTFDLTGSLVLEGADAATGTLNVSGDAVVNLGGSTIVGRNISNEGGTVTGAIIMDGGNVTASDVIVGQGEGAVGTVALVHNNSGATSGNFAVERLIVGSGGTAAGSVTQTGGDVFFKILPCLTRRVH